MDQFGSSAGNKICSLRQPHGVIRAGYTGAVDIQAIADCLTLWLDVGSLSPETSPTGQAQTESY